MEHLNTMVSGKLIVIEGLDGAGKTTLAEQLTQYFRASGMPVALVGWSEPSVIFSYIESLNTMHYPLYPQTYALLHNADFFLKLKTRIVPALQEGKVVICDRYWYTEIVRDIAMGLDHGCTQSVFRSVPEPDSVIYLQITPEKSQERVKERMRYLSQEVNTKSLGTLTGSLSSGIEYDEDGSVLTDEKREKKILAFQKKVLEAYEDFLKNKKNLIVVNGEDSMDTVFETIKNALDIVNTNKK